MEEDEEEEEEDWKSPFSNSNSNFHHHPSSLSSPPFSISSSHSLSPIRTTPNLLRHHHPQNNDFSIFPPINHEGLHPLPPTPPPPRAPLSLPSSDSDSDSDSNSQPPSPSSKPHFPKWVDFALHLWSSKIQSLCTQVRSFVFFWSIRLGVMVVPCLVVLWFWVRRIRRRCGGSGTRQEGVDQLKLLVKEKDEKIIQLLMQIAQLNKLLLARYRIPLVKSG